MSILASIKAFLKKEFQSRPKVNDKVQVNLSNKSGIITKVVRNNEGSLYYEGYSSCTVRFQDGSSRVYYENELELV